MADNPDGAWSTEELCLLVYPGLNRVEDKHRSAVIRSIKSMTFPDGWGIWRIDSRYFGYVVHAWYSDEAVTRWKYLEELARYHKTGWRKWPPEPYEEWCKDVTPYAVKQVKEIAASRRKYRDVSPAERIDVDIAQYRQMISQLGVCVAYGNREASMKSVRQYTDKINELEKKKAQLILEPTKRTIDPVEII
jgi:hypothetical protein